MRGRPLRLLYVQRDRLRFPLDEAQEYKWDALSEMFDVRVVTGLAEGEPDGRFVPVARYPALLPRVAVELRRFRPDLAIAQTPFEGAVLMAAGASRVLVDVHGDWRVSTRAYGSPLRRLAAPVADRVAAFAIRRAAGVRTISPFTSALVRRLGREPDAEFPTFADLRAFRSPPVPLPSRPSLLFVGMLEPVKNVAVLADAVRQVESSHVTVVGDGSQRGVVQRLVADGRATWKPRLARAEVAAELDAATALVLPSRSEGLGRVVVEAFCRARPVVGSRVGAIPDLVEEGVSGLLVPPGDVDALAAALRRITGERDLAEQLAAGASAAASRWTIDADEHVARTRELVERVLLA